MADSAPVFVLVIDDDLQPKSLISAAFGHEFDVRTENTSEAGFKTFLRLRPRIVLLGISRGELDLMDQILAEDPGVSIIVMSARYSTEAAVQAIQKGAADYLTKPVDVDKLRDRLASLRLEAEIRKKTLTLEQELLEACTFEGMVSRSPLMLEVFAKIRRVAPHFKVALITGATGTGKELVARALHRQSPATRNRFVACNCSAIVDSLVESELFGYVKGAFTGANRDTPGLFESADGGTLFLDEIGELPLGTQAKLLRVLQDHRVRRVGSAVAHDVDLRVIAATNRDLRAMVRAGTFREDLYYRLAVVEILLPRLEERREDIPLLQRHFLERFSGEYQRPVVGLSRRAQSRIATYSWPGNIRELENAIGNACMMADDKFIDVQDLPERIREISSGYGSGDESLSSLQEAQTRHVMRVLERVGGNKLKAARILGVGRNTIYKMLSRVKAEKRDLTA